MGGVGRRPGEGPPRVTLTAVPITPSPRSSSAPSRSRCRSLDLPQLRRGRRFYKVPSRYILPSRGAKRSGRGRPKAGGGPAACCTHRRPNNALAPKFTIPLPISLPLAPPPPASLGEEVYVSSPPCKNRPGGAAKRDNRYFDGTFRSSTAKAFPGVNRIAASL